MGRWQTLVSLCVAGGLAPELTGCQNFDDPPVSFVTGLRVLGIKAQPPEVPAGASASIAALAVDTGGGAPAATWSACTRPPLAGQTVNPDCVDTAAASYLAPIGDGLTITATMPRCSNS